MNIYIYKIFSLTQYQYLTDNGVSTWYDIPSVAVSFSAISRKEYVEIHKILLTKVIDVSESEE